MRVVLTVLFLALAVASPRTAGAQADDWGVKRNPFDPRVIARTKALLDKDPGDKGALARLVTLYRKHSSVKKLVAEYEAEVGKRTGAALYAPAMVLGHLHRMAGDNEAALAAYEKASAARPEDVDAHVARGELLRVLRKTPEARAAFEAALSHATTPAAKKAVLRTLADLALGDGDMAAARRAYDQMLALDPKNVETRLQLGDALAQHGLHAEAAVEYEKAAATLRADPARRVTVLASIGREYQALGRDDDAVRIYREAIDTAGKDHYLRRELTERIIDIYRKKQDVRALVTYYEKAWPEGRRGHFEWDVLARLYEAVGDQEKALAAYRKAVAAAPTELETQRRLIALLELAGKEEEALAQYERVVKIAPGDPRFQLELAERYFRAGKKAQGLAMLKRVAARFAGDPGVQGALAEAYRRWGEEELAIDAYERLVRIEPEDATHLENLGEQYFQKGDTKRAVAIWKRIAAARTPQAYARLAEVYAEHDMGEEAVDTYSKAIALSPQDPELYRGLAGAHERQRDLDRAVEAWNKVLALTADDPAQKPLRREARTRIVSILSRKSGNPLLAETRKWERQFEEEPPDMESGYFLAEAYLKRGKHEEAERVLVKILKLRPEDLDAMNQLVAVYKSLGRLDDAIRVLKRLAELQPGREREYYTEIAKLELLLYRDDQALAYVEKAREKNPNDPGVHERLGDIYEKKEQFDRAIAAYAKVIELDPRNFEVRSKLAALYLRRGQHREAAHIYREILKLATDEELVTRVARRAVDLEEYLGTLGELETHLSPLVFAHAAKPVYRRTLVMLYERYVPPLVARARAGGPDAEPARKELLRIGEHGLRPLLEALADDDDPDQQRIAVSVLGHVGNRNATGALVALAVQEPDARDAQAPASRRMLRLASGMSATDLRVRAIVAVGLLADPKALPALTALAGHDEKNLRLAAVWALGRTAAKKAQPVLVASLSDAAPGVQAMACVALGAAAAGDRLDRVVLDKIRGVARDQERFIEARAACATTLGAVGDAGAVDILVATLAEGNGQLQVHAAWALGNIGDARALAPLLGAYWQKKGAVRARVAEAIARIGGSAGDPSGPLAVDMYLNGSDVDVARVVSDALPGARDGRPDPALLVKGEAAITAGLGAALAGHHDLVARALRDLDARPAGLGLGSLVAPGNAPAALDAMLARLATAIAPRLIELAARGDADVRGLALRLLAKLGHAEAPAHITAALDAKEEPVRHAAFDAARRYYAVAGPAAARPVALKVADRLAAPGWAERTAAARALGDMPKAAPVDALLARAADPSGFVREAVAHALGETRSKDALPALRALTKDPVEEVRTAAQTALRRIAG